ncbi:GTR11 protein, partial [Calyptomena viridis]|nr:GTR11 protein [Calyptomena viridis]
AALQNLRGTRDLSAELEEMLAEQAAVKGQRAKNLWELFQNPSLRWQLVSTVVLSSAMQLCRNDSMYFYAAYVFQEAGIPQDKIPYVVIGTGSCELIMSVTCVRLLMHSADMRPLLTVWRLLITNFGFILLFMTKKPFKHSSQAICQHPQPDRLMQKCVLLFLMSTILLIFLPFLFPAGIIGVLPTEVFDQMSRPAAYMICGSLLWFNLFLVGTAFPFIVKSLAHFCYIPFLVVCVCTALYVGFFLPETKGKSFLEISEEFNKRNFKTKTRAGFYKGPEEIKTTIL